MCEQPGVGEYPGEDLRRTLTLHSVPTEMMDITRTHVPYLALSVAYEHGNGLETPLNTKQYTKHTFDITVSLSVCVTSL